VVLLFGGRGEAVRARRKERRKVAWSKVKRKNSVDCA